MDCATLPEYFGKRYGKGVKLLSCILHILTNIAALSVQFTVSCTVLHIITGFNINVSLVISVLIVLFLTSGGLRAVVNTDAVLFIIIVISILLMVPFSIRAAGGYATLKANVPVEFFRFDQLGAWTPISWILLCMLNYSTNQNYIQRMVSAKDTGTAKFGALFTAGFYVIISMALGLIGIAAYVLLPGIEDSNMIFATMLVRFFPHGLLGIGLAAVFAATISTGTSMLHATATLIVNDIYVPLGKSERNDQSILVTSRICAFCRGTVRIEHIDVLQQYCKYLLYWWLVLRCFCLCSNGVRIVLQICHRQSCADKYGHDCCAEFVVGVFSIFSYQCACTDSVQCLWTGCQRRDDLHHIGAYK